LAVSHEGLLALSRDYNHNPVESCLAGDAPGL
jgi:hypothetical protein